jgi:membrane-bound serine protease (ClpP class)
MSIAIQLFVILLVSGLFLIGAEIFVPGGILGTLGAVALVGAVVAAFVAFPPAAAGYITVGIVLLIGVALVAWIRLFPKSPMGRKMTVARDLSDSKGTEDGLDSLLGKVGKAISDLRPGGFATIDGRRVDVVTQGEMIDDGATVRVVEIEGNRVVVVEAEESSKA